MSSNKKSEDEAVTCSEGEKIEANEWLRESEEKKKKKELNVPPSELP